jgi:BspA type Leucine rich repeat region (6 copies)
MKGFRMILLLALSPLMAEAQVNYMVVGDTAFVTNSPNASGNIVISSSYDGYPVTSIGNAAFFGCTELTGVTIPDGVTTIGDIAFWSCSSLTTVTIPNSVTSIGDGAFDACTSLPNVTVPDGVTNIGEAAFWSCSSLTAINIPGTVTGVGENTFTECTSMTNVVIADGVTSIGDNAFYDCTNLISVTIPDSVTNIGAGPFAFCTGLTNISVDAANPDYVSLNGILFNKSQSDLIQYPVGLQPSAYSIPNDVTSIGEFAFYDCVSLTNVTIPNSVTNIGDSAFGACSLMTVTIPNSVISIGNQAFGLSDSLNAAYFQGNAPSEDGLAFQSNPATTAWYLPGTMGWGTNFGGAATALWYQPQPQVLSFEPSFGMQNGQFGFTISWATNADVIVQACTNLFNPAWIPLATNALSGGTNYFNDSKWANYPARYYRVTGS